MVLTKTIKKIAALGTGAVMIGSSILGASAAELSQYPSQYIDDGKFVGVMVVGDKAAAEDVIGVSDIAVSLQAAAVRPAGSGSSAVKKVSSGVSSVGIEGDAWMVGSSNKLELSEALANTGTNRETMRNVTTFIDDNDLDALSSGEVSNSKATSPFNQYLYLLSGTSASSGVSTGYVAYTEEDNTDDDLSSDFLVFTSGTEIARYLLEFTTALESDVDDSTGSSSTTGLFLTDLEDIELTMFGKPYTVVTAKRTSTVGNNVVLTLMGGATRDTLLEKDTKTYSIGGNDYEVTLEFVDADEAQFTINGQTTRKLKDGDTDKLADGTNVGLTSVLYQDYAGGIHSATFFIGANKLELKDTNIRDVASSHSVKVDDDTIDDSFVIIEGTDDNSTFKINRIHVNMTADDTFFVGVGGKLSENPDMEESVLFTENWDIEYKGLTQEPTEEIELSTSGDTEYQLSFLDGDGDKVKVPIAKVDNSILKMGEASKPFINSENASIVKDAYLVVTDGSRKRGERKSYVLQYKGADKEGSDNPVLKFKNLGSGETIEQTWSAGSTVQDGVRTEIATLKIGGADFKVFNTSSVAVNDFSVHVDLDASGGITGSSPSGATNTHLVNITTMYGAEIGLDNTTSGGIVLSIKTPDEARDGASKDSVDTLQATDYVVNITRSGTEVAHSELTGHTSGQKGNKLNLRTPQGETNVAYGYSSYGAWFERNTPTNDPAYVTVTYPSAQRLPQVFITAKGASFTETTAGEGDAVTIQKIDVGATKLASEVADIEAVNSILVGGPCANAAAAEVMGNPADCTEGFEPGVGKIQMWDVGTGNVAMLVAGYSALDTRNAAQVVANSGNYKNQLKGTSVEVRRVNNQLTVAAPTPASAMEDEEEVVADDDTA